MQHTCPYFPISSTSMTILHKAVAFIAKHAEACFQEVEGRVVCDEESRRKEDKSMNGAVSNT